MGEGVNNYQKCEAHSQDAEAKREELKPCPFCGSANTADIDHNTVGCLDCKHAWQKIPNKPSAALDAALLKCREIVAKIADEKAAPVAQKVEPIEPLRPFVFPTIEDALKNATFENCINAIYKLAESHNEIITRLNRLEGVK